MYPSEIATINSKHKRITAYLTECAKSRAGDMTGLQDSLGQRISCNISLNEAQISAGVALLGHGCRYRTKDRIEVALRCCPKLLNHGIYNRVLISGEGMSYCAGQDYPSEIALVRKLLIGG